MCSKPLRLALLALVGVTTAVAALALARASSPPPADAATWVLVTPSNMCGGSVPSDWALVKSGKGAMIWASPSARAGMEPK